MKNNKVLMLTGVICVALILSRSLFAERLAASESDQVANINPSLAKERMSAEKDWHSCTGACVTGLTSAVNGDMLGKTNDSGPGEWALWNIVEMVTPKRGIRCLSVGVNIPNYKMEPVLNEKGLARTGYYRHVPVFPEYQGPDIPKRMSYDDLFVTCSTAKEYIQKSSEYMTKWGGVESGVGQLICDPKEAYLLENANWVYNDPANHAVTGPLTDQVFAQANFYVNETLKGHGEKGIGFGYTRAKAIWQTLIEHQYDGFGDEGITLPIFMSAFRSHGTYSVDELSMYSYLPAERGVPAVCSHGVDVVTENSYIVVCRTDNTDLLSCFWKTFSQPCLSPYLPIYIGINSVPKDMKTTKCAKVFEDLRIALVYHPEYRDAVKAYWTHFETETMTQCMGVEKQVADLVQAGEKVDARALLTKFVEDKCTEAMVAGKKLVEDINRVSTLRIK